jgi:hypothetical protein
LEKDYEEVGAESSDGKDDDEEYWMIAVLFFLLCHCDVEIVGTNMASLLGHE